MPFRQQSRALAYSMAKARLRSRASIRAHLQRAGRIQSMEMIGDDTETLREIENLLRG